MYGEAGQFAGGAMRNYEYFGRWTRFERDLEEWQRLLMFDPQTSGGLLLSVDGDYASKLMGQLEARSVSARIVGEAVQGRGRGIRVI